MDKSAKQLLRDPDMKPSNALIAEGLGETNGTYVKFVEELKNYGITLMDWRYYNDGKAWLSKGEFKWTTSRGTKKVKPIFWLSIWEGFFKVSFFFSEKTREELLNLPVSEEALGLIKNSPTIGKNRKYVPIIFDVENSKLLKDIYVLAQCRKEKI